MKKRIFFQFSEDVELFCDLAKLSVTLHGNIILILPVLCYYGDYFSKKLLFKTEFQTIVSDLDEIYKYHKTHNLDLFFKKFFPESDFLQILMQKAKRWISKNKPKPTKIKGTEYICGTEFIEVDADTSFYGNFEQDGKQGCYLRFGENVNCKELASFNYFPYLSEYDIPYSLRNGITFTGLSNEERFAIINGFGLKVKLEIFKRKLAYFHTSFVEEKYCPFRVKLQGGDDDSWTKYFCTKEEMMDEVYRLRRCQPISKELDVYGNGYYFTN